MIETRETKLTPLDDATMAGIAGGGDGGESFARWLGHSIGAIAGLVVYVLETAPEANYAYAKVGYSS